MQLLKTKSDGGRRFVDLYRDNDGSAYTYLMKFNHKDPDGINHYVPEKAATGDFFESYVRLMMESNNEDSA